MNTRSIIIIVTGVSMGLYKRKGSNIWQMRFSVNGKMIRMSTKTSNKKVAKRIYEKKKVELAEGKQSINEMGKMPFDRLVDEFIEKHSKVEKVSFRHDIYIGGMFKRYFNQTPIEKITAYDILSWRKSRKNQVTCSGKIISKATINRELSVLKRMFSLAVEWGWLKESPCVTIKKLKGEVQRLRYLNRVEIGRLLDSGEPFLKPIIIVAISTGMRRGEILNLKWKDVDFENGFIRVEKSKNHESRDIPMDNFLFGTLREIANGAEAGDHVFCRKSGKQYKTLRCHFQNAVKKAGIEDFRFHDLRHTAASLLASGGCDIITLKNILGHKSLAMTQRYAHFMPDQHEKTRRIMGNIWESVCNTKNDTPVLIEGNGSGQNAYQHKVFGHIQN